MDSFKFLERVLQVQLDRLETKLDKLADDVNEYIEEERERHALDEAPLQTWDEETELGTGSY